MSKGLHSQIEIIRKDQRNVLIGLLDIDTIGEVCLAGLIQGDHLHESRHLIEMPDAGMWSQICFAKGS